MDHDRIMNAHEGEKTRVEEEATHIAQRAAEALRRSRLIRSRDSISVPTWTGRLGSAGAPPSLRPKFGSTPNPAPGQPIQHHGAGAPSGRPLSSAHLLAKLKETRESAILDGLRHQRGPPPYGSGRIQPEVLIRQMCSFIELQGGKATSSSIVNNFKDRVPSAQLSLFKNLLKEIAILQKESTGSSSSSSLWELKPEYSQQHLQK